MDLNVVDVGYMEQDKFKLIESFPAGRSGDRLYFYFLSKASPFKFERINWQEARAYGIAKAELKQFIDEYYKARPVSMHDRGLWGGRDIQEDLPKLIKAVDELDETGVYCIRAVTIPG